MTYPIMTEEFNSLIEVQDEYNNDYYLADTELILSKEINDLSKIFLSKNVYSDQVNLLQFRDYILLDMTTRDMYHISSLNRDNYTRIAERLKLIVYRYSKDDKIGTSYILVRNDLSFEDFYRLLQEQSYSITSKMSLFDCLKHIDKGIRFDIIPKYLQVDILNRYSSVVCKTEDEVIRRYVKNTYNKLGV